MMPSGVGFSARQTAWQSQRSRIESIPQSTSGSCVSFEAVIIGRYFNGNRPASGVRGTCWKSSAAGEPKSGEVCRTGAAGRSHGDGRRRVQPMSWPRLVMLVQLQTTLSARLVHFGTKIVELGIGERSYRVDFVAAAAREDPDGRRSRPIATVDWVVRRLVQQHGRRSRFVSMFTSPFDVLRIVDDTFADRVAADAECDYIDTARSIVTFPVTGYLRSGC